MSEAKRNRPLTGRTKTSLALDYLVGGLSYADLAQKYGLHYSGRAAQIVKEECRRYALVADMPSTHWTGYLRNHRLELGRKLGQKMQRIRADRSTATPEGFYWAERRAEAEDERERQYGLSLPAYRW